MKKILIIEDEEQVSKPLEFKLKNEGFEVVVVEDGETGLEKLKKIKPDILILDIILPTLNGFSILEKIKKDKIKIDTIVFSNLTQEADKKRAHDLGVKEYISKQENSLNEVVNLIVEKYL